MLSPEDAITIGKLVAQKQLDLFYDQEQITIDLEGYILIFHVNQGKIHKVECREPSGKIGFKKV